MTHPALQQQQFPQEKNSQVLPFLSGGSPALAPGVNAGAVSIEQERAIAEAQGQLVLAKRFPRKLSEAYEDLMNACKVPAFAEVAFYSVPNRGTGPTIRFAEECARAFGNFQYGHRELARSEGKSEIEVFAWDMEKNNRNVRQITVKHVRDTKGGGVPLRDEADIDNKIANVASKQIRGRILALMPKWLVEEAIQQCRKTLAGNNDEPIDIRIRRIVQAFAKYGVRVEHLEAYLGHVIDNTLADEIAELQGVYNALKEGAKASEFFGDLNADAKAEQAEQAAEAIQQAAQVNPPARRRRGAVADLADARQARQAREQAETEQQEPALDAESVPGAVESNDNADTASNADGSELF